MRIGIPREQTAGERRVAGTPATVRKLVSWGFELSVERGAGAHASYPDAAYAEAGATLCDTETLWQQSDLVLKVNAPLDDEIPLIREGCHLISFVWPASNAELVQKLAARKITLIAMDCIPRISRAQKMDALSSMANIAGYRAVVEAANLFGSFFTGQFTAAGKVPPAKVLVIGAGVAGLAAIGAAKSLGAIVRAFDVRPTVKDQVQSLGAEFLEVDIDESGEGQGGYAKVMSEAFIKAEMDLFYEQAKDIDIVITTALIPGRPAPKLWEKRAVERMKPGSVVIDLAAAQGGNCEVTQADQVIDHGGVKVAGLTDLASRMAHVASQLYGTNLCHLLDDMGKGEGYKIDLEDEVVRGALVLHDGALMWPPPKREKPKPKPKPVVETPPPAAEPAPAPKKAKAKSSGHGHGHAGPPADPNKPLFSPVSGVIGLALVGLWLFLRFGTTQMAGVDQAFLQHLTVFVLSVFVGWQVVWSVTAALHTPLMSVTNAISGIIIVGGLLQANGNMGDPSVILGAVAVLFATINIAGGFLVTQRMLKMFQK